MTEVSLVLEFKITEESNRLRFQKKDFNFKNDPGPPIVGWINRKSLGIWINHLRGLENEFFNLTEHKEINPDHITLYEDGQIIGWIEKKYKDKILDSLWSYLKENGGAAKNDKKEDLKIEDNGQLRLF